MVLVVVEHQDGTFQKKAFEALTYGRKSANLLGVPCVALAIGNVQSSGDLGKYGAERVIEVEGPDHFDDMQHCHIIAEVAKSLDASMIVMNHSAKGKTLVGRLGVRLGYGTVSGVSALPKTHESGVVFTKSVFSGKAHADLLVKGGKSAITVMGNVIPIEESGATVSPETMPIEIPSSSVEFVSSDKVTGTVPLPEADLVVSAGRGMKGPENWGIIEELANVLGATTACSRPVADVGWRPHHEHVGQTGIAIRPNLYIAIGISGAIQHLAGVNNSKVIVVINKDPEAPFFKAADYGVVADLFDVVPQLTEAIRKLKS